MHAWHPDGEMTVALTIKNAEVERLAAEVARLTGESKTQAVRVALEERRRRLTSGIDPEARAAEIWRWLETEVWPHVPPEERGRPHDSARDDAILGYGPDGLPE
jgi:antitoxin VapB